MSAPQYSNSSKYTTYAHNNHKFGHNRFDFCLIPKFLILHSLNDHYFATIYRPFKKFGT